MLKRIFSFLKQIPLTLRYGVLLAVALIIVKTLEYQLFSYRLNMELYTGLIAAFFMLIGLAFSLGWFSMQSKRKKRDADSNTPKEALTAKEIKLLQGLENGLTNQQLADTHCLSVNTIKTHLKSLYRKLDVSNRSEAVAKAKKWTLI